MTSKLLFFDKEYFERERSARGLRWGRPVRVHDEIGSTNDLALEAASGDMKTGGLFLARHQTGGRGRRGNLWLSAPGENLTFSLLLRLPMPAEKLHGLSLVIGLAIAEACEGILRESSLTHPVLVKWPNDVLVSDRKLAGILLEARTRGKETAVVVGIGCNVLQTNFPEGAGHPTSLAALGISESKLGKEELLLRLLASLEPKIENWLKNGLAGSYDAIGKRDALVERNVLVDDRKALSHGISPAGRLEVSFEEGERVSLDSAHVTLIRD